MATLDLEPWHLQNLERRKRTTSARNGSYAAAAHLSDENREMHLTKEALDEIPSNTVETVSSVACALSGWTGVQSRSILTDTGDLKEILKDARETSYELSNGGPASNSQLNFSCTRHAEQVAEGIESSLGTRKSNIKSQSIADHVAAKQRSVEVNPHLDSSESNFLLQCLPSVKATWESAQACLPGTRASIIETIMNWATSDVADHRNIFWLSGSAGTGKSAIAHSVAEQLSNKGLVSCFFFKRDSVDRNNARVVFSTLARDLAIHNPDFHHQILPILQGNDKLGNTGPLIQFSELITKPLLGMIRANSRTHVHSQLVIWDALDECQDIDLWRVLLKVLRTGVPGLSPALRFIITSRPSRQIRQALGNTHVIHHSLDSYQEESEKDLMMYFQHALREVGISQQLPEHWFLVDDVQSLLEHAEGLFIWAATAIRLLRHSISPYTQLQLLFHSTAPAAAALNPLDRLYYKILAGPSLPHFTEAFQLVIGAMVVLQKPLSAGALSGLIDYQNVSVVVKELSAVLSPSPSGHEIQILHPSFFDFLTNHAHNTPSDYYVDRGEHHARLTIHCMVIIRSFLEQNISKIRHCTMLDMNPKIPAMVLELERHQQVPELLQYACIHWGSHALSSCESHVPKLLPYLRTFYGRDLFFWLEVMSLFKQASSAIASLRSMYRLLSFWQVDRALKEISYDAFHFAERFAYPLENSANHLYLSALAFTPQNTLLYKRQFCDSPASVKVVQGYDATWDHTPTTLEHPDYVASVVFSHDGRHIISGSYDKMIHVWDAEIGQLCLSPLEGHSMGILSVAVSYDGHRIVSGSHDKTICVWDVETGHQSLPTLEGHSKGVMSVAFSPNGHHIISGSYDNTIRIWDACTGTLYLPPFQGHTKGVSAVAYSPDGHHIVSGSHDMTVRVWDAHTGQPSLPPFKAHTNAVTCIALSFDGLNIISASLDKTLQMWDATTGEPCLSRLEGHTDAVTSVAFSPDGHSIVSGSDDKTIRVWDAVTGDLLLPPLKGHTSWVTSVAFSPDGQSIVSGSWDRTVRMWNLEQQGNNVVPLERHDGLVFSIVFAPDGKHVVSGSADKTVRVWDAETGNPSLPPLEGHQDLVLTVACSVDSQCIASGSADDTVRIWDMHTGRTVGMPLIGHTARVVTASFASDGVHLISSSWDRTVRLWDYRTGQLTQQLSSAQAMITLPSLGEKESEEKDSHFSISDDFWICSKSKERLCWIPPVHRGKAAFSEAGVALGSPSGRVTIIRLT